MPIKSSLQPSFQLKKAKVSKGNRVCTSRVQFVYCKGKFSLNPTKNSIFYHEKSWVVKTRSGRVN